MKKFLIILSLSFLFIFNFSELYAQYVDSKSDDNTRQRISINDGWHFFKYDAQTKADDLIYDVRPDIAGNHDYKVADAEPTEAEDVTSDQKVLKSSLRASVPLCESLCN